jgi:hypothetical protein
VPATFARCAFMSLTAACSAGASGCDPRWGTVTGAGGATVGAFGSLFFAPAARPAAIEPSPAMPVAANSLPVSGPPGAPGAVVLGACPTRSGREPGFWYSDTPETLLAACAVCIGSLPG